jgi:hypothetical protein
VETVSLKRWHLPTSLHGAKSQKNIFLTNAKTSNLTFNNLQLLSNLHAYDTTCRSTPQIYEWYLRFLGWPGVVENQQTRNYIPSLGDDSGDKIENPLAIKVNNDHEMKTELNRRAVVFMLHRMTNKHHFNTHFSKRGGGPENITYK